jgi:large subunit ribosomal protein L24
MAMSIKKGDTVQVISGKDRGATGRVIVVDHVKELVIVEGVNRVKRHNKVDATNRSGTTGGIEIKEAPVHVSNVMLIDPSDDRATRIGYRKDKVTKNRPDGTTYESTRSVRIARRSGKEI